MIIALDWENLARE